MKYKNYCFSSSFLFSLPPYFSFRKATRLPQLLLHSVNSDTSALHRTSTLSLSQFLPLLAAICHCNYLSGLSLFFQHLCCLLSAVEVSFDKNTMEHVLPDLPHSSLWHQAFFHLLLFFLLSLGLIINIIIPLLYEEKFLYFLCLLCSVF